jgi:hypothetical protein
MSALVDSGGAPRGAKVPDQIVRDGLFQLDVDNSIWQDIPLNDGEDMPRWLGDEQVREGIKWMLQLDRCREEEHRLLRERVAMQDWMTEEWSLIERAQQCTVSVVATYVEFLCLTYVLHENSSLMYQLECKKVSLARLCAIWQTKVQGIPFSSTQVFPTSWGPSESDILQALKLEYTASWEWDQEEEVEELEGMDEEIDEERQEMWEMAALEEVWHDDDILMLH